MSDVPTATLRAGRYVITGVLGAGSQGETLDAVDKKEGRAVAIKRFQVRGARSWKDVELAEREARVLATLAHPNLPVYVEHFEEAGALYLVMEKIEGETLASLRQRQALLSTEDVVRFLTDTASILGYLHSRVPPIIHRDIKPGNVIRRTDGSFALVDFGSVRDRLKPEGGSTVVGTFGYMAPEQFQGRALAGSDVYAVGATLLSLLTGREPEDLPHRGLAVDVPAALGGAVEPWLVRALSTMLEPDPDKRATRVPGPGRSRRSPANPPAAGAFRQEREQRRRAHEEGRNFREDLKQQVRDEARRVRREARRYRASRHQTWHAPRRHGFGPATPLVISVVFLALTIARLATFGLFQVFLPSLLFTLSLFAGPSLRRAAFRCREVGVEGEQGLKRAMAVIRERMLGEQFDVEPPESDADLDLPRRTRVAPEPTPAEAQPHHPELADDAAETSARRAAR